MKAVSSFVPGALGGMTGAGLGFLAAGPVGAFVGGTVGAAAGAAAMVFGRSGAWQLLYNRTRIDFRREVGDPATNSIVGAVVKWICRNFPDAPVRIQREGAPGDEATILPSATGAGFMLRLLEKPNPKWSGFVMWMATLVDYIVRGDAYWLKVRSAGDRVIELWWVPYDTMKPRWPMDDPTVFISHYEYVVDSRAYRIETRDVVHFRNGLNPANQGRTGISALESLYREIFTDNEAAQFSAALLRNMGVPGVTIAPTNTITQGLGVDPETVKERFMEKFGGDKRGEPFVSNLPIEIKTISFNPQQMDLKNLRRVPEERVSAVLGVPAGVAQLGAGLDRNTFSNLGEAKGSAYTEGVIPLQRLFAADLEVQLLPEFVDTERTPLDVFFDWKLSAAMAEAAGDIWKRHESAASKGLVTRAAFKRATGQKAGPEDEVYILPNNFTVVPAGGNQPPGGRPQLSAPNDPRPDAVAPSTASVATAPGSELRCSGTFRGEPCDQLLAESAPPGTKVKCRRCHLVTEVPLEIAA